MADRRPAVPPFRWLAVSAGNASEDDGAATLAWLRSLADAAQPVAGAVQLRDKALDDRALWRLAGRARTLLDDLGLEAGPALIVNGRPDIAIAVGADGVHLPATGWPVTAVRRWLGHRPGSLLGVSTHTAEEVAAARRAGADYVVFGPVYETPSKARFGPPTGLEGLERAVAAAHGLPVLALGGLRADRVAAVAAAGASGVAGIRCFADPVAMAELLSALASTIGP